MARKDLKRFRMPREYEDEVLEILRTYGELVDPPALADMLGVEPKALQNFLQTTRAREAIESAPKNAKVLLRPHFANIESDTQPFSYGPTIPEGVDQIIEVIPDSLTLAFSKLSKKKRAVNDV